MLLIEKIGLKNWFSSKVSLDNAFTVLLNLTKIKTYIEQGFRPYLALIYTYLGSIPNKTAYGVARLGEGMSARFPPSSFTTGESLAKARRALRSRDEV